MVVLEEEEMEVVETEACLGVVVALLERNSEHLAAQTAAEAMVAEE